MVICKVKYSGVMLELHYYATSKKYIFNTTVHQNISIIYLYYGYLITY